MYLLFVVSNYGHGPSTAKQEPFRRHVILARDLEEAPLPLSFLQLVKNFLFTFPLKRKRKLEFTNFRFPTLFPTQSKYTKKPSTKTTVSNFYFAFLCGKRKWRSDKRFHKFFFWKPSMKSKQKKKARSSRKSGKKYKTSKFSRHSCPVFRSYLTDLRNACRCHLTKHSATTGEWSFDITLLSYTGTELCYYPVIIHWNWALTLPSYNTLELSFLLLPCYNTLELLDW